MGAATKVWRNRKGRFALAALVAAVLLMLLLLFVPPYVESARNRLHSTLAVTVSPQALALHRQLTVVDLHADSLLWSRDLGVRGSRGHTDVPRMIAGNVALQVFSIVTKVPAHLNIERNTDTSDDITLLAMVQRWPPRSWFNLTARAHYQAQKLARVAAHSGGNFRIIRTRNDLAEYLDRRRHDPRLAAGLLSVEGAHALQGDLRNLDALYTVGVRMMAPAHFFDNEIGGSAHGVGKTGLSVLGRQWVKAMEAKGMVIDLAHAAPRTLADILALATKPVIVSHTGVTGTCDNRRNLSDAQLRAIAKTGGVIGIGFWPEAICDDDVPSIARAIRYAAGVVGVQHVALGSDFDGAVAVPLDAAQLAQLTQSLLDVGFAAHEIKLIMGQNALRVLLQILPPADDV